MNNSIFFYIRKVCVFINEIDKEFSSFLFANLSEKYFILNNKNNNFIKEVFFVYPSYKVEVTNKFKWFINDDICYEDIKHLYISLSNENDEIRNIDNNNILNKPYIIKISTTDNKCLILNITNNKYYIKKNNDVIVNDITFNVIPFNELD